MEGLEGIGHASVLGGSVNPLQLYIQQGYNKQRQQAAQQQYAAKKRDDYISDLDKWNLRDKAWDPQYKQVGDFIQKGREQDMSMLEQGVPLHVIQRESSRWKNEAEILSAKSRGMKDVFDGVGKAIDGDAELDPKYYHSKLNDHFFDGIVAKDINQVDPTKAMEVLNDSKGYNVDAVTTNFMKGLPEQINKYYTDLYGQYGKDYDITQTETKLGHEYTVGKDGQRHIVVDPTTGLPKVNMTDDVYIAAMQNPKLRNLVKDNVGDNATVEQKRAYLTQILKAKDKNSIQKGIQMGHAKSEAERGGEAVDQNISDRYQRTERVVTGYHPEDLANIFDPTQFAGKDQKIFYADANGKEWSDKAVGAPPTIHMEVSKYDPSFLSGISDLPESERKKVIKEHAKTFTADFDLTTEKGRRQWHEVSNRMLDAQMGQKERLGEKYSKYVSEQYQKRGSAGSLNASEILKGKRK